MQHFCFRLHCNNRPHQNNRILKTGQVVILYFSTLDIDNIDMEFSSHQMHCENKKDKIGVFHTLPKLPHCCGSCVKVCWKWKRQVENSCQPFSAQTRNFKISKVALAEKCLSHFWKSSITILIFTILILPLLTIWKAWIGLTWAS